MGAYLQACAGVLTALVLILTLGGSKGKETGTLLALGVCCMVAVLALEFLSPVMELLDKLEALGGLDSGTVEILLKAAGIGILSETAALICSDAGNASLGKTLQLLGCAVILWLSVPLFEILMALLERILGEL